MAVKQEIINLYDEFTHRGLDRRIFMSRLAELAGGTAAATSAAAAGSARSIASAAVAAAVPPASSARRLMKIRRSRPRWVNSS